MKTIRTFTKFNSRIANRIKFCFFSLVFLLPNYSLLAQCSIIPFVNQQPTCDDMGDTDPTNDEFSFTVFVATAGSSGSWTADNPSSTTGNYDSAATFGPYPVSGGNVTITFTDDVDPGCTEQITIMAPTDCGFVCPDYNVCYELISSDECTATYVVDFDGDF